jgi:hypothetical protein
VCPSVNKSQASHHVRRSWITFLKRSSSLLGIPASKVHKFMWIPYFVRLTGSIADMELYTTLAKEFYRAGRKQILGIFIRDVNPEPTRQESLGFSPAVTPPRSSSPRGSSLFAPTLGAESPDLGTYFTASTSTTAPANMMTPPPPYNTHYFSKDPDSETTLGSTTDTPANDSELDRNVGQVVLPPPLPYRPSSTFSGMSTPGSSSNPASAPSSFHNSTGRPAPQPRQGSSDSTMSDPTITAAIANAAASTPSLTKKRAEFRVRLARAREGMPPDVPFIVFEHPEECMEVANNILDGLGVGGLKNY